MILTIMSEHKESNKINEELEDSCDNDNNNKLILKNIINGGELFLCIKLEKKVTVISPR